MLQQLLNFSMETGTASDTGASGTRIHGLSASADPVRQRILGFLVPGEVESPATTILVRTCVGLVLVDRAFATESAAETLYAVRHPGGGVSLVRGGELPVTARKAVLGRVVQMLAGARSLRYVPNLHLLENVRRRRLAVRQESAR